VTRTGLLRVNRRGTQPWQLEQSCSLDVADQGGVGMNQIAIMLGVTRQAADLVRVKATSKLCRRLAGWRGHAPPERRESLAAKLHAGAELDGRAA